ncbi:YtxH domain-containing protein [Paenibacillus sp. sgz500958]|uniref:YtxH domain-containing protein n=1 Tax=Paenibacillus sp. sgz500958 TaxID=3242475 RepID=UPI0036D31D91
MKSNKSLLWGVIAGSVVGTVTALLFAPKAGKELRKDIADGTAATLEKVQEVAGQAGDKGAEIIDKTKEVVIQVREWGKQHLGLDEEEVVEVSGFAVAETEDAVSELDNEVAIELADTDQEIAPAAVSDIELEEVTTADVQDESGKINIG